MTMYRVSATFSQRELIDFIDANGTVDLKIEAVPDAVSQGDDAAKETSPRALRTKSIQRRKRGSKVVETILKTLEEAGPNGAEIKELKVDLGRAGLSENSLSTGLAVLQKNGKIKRSGDGFYALADAA